MEWTQEAARTLRVSSLPVPQLYECDWAARLPMTTDCANAILRRSDGLKPAPQVSKRWARRFLEHPEYLVRKQKVRGVGRENARNTGVILECPQKFGEFATSMEYHHAIYLTPASRDFVLELDGIRGS